MLLPCVPQFCGRDRFPASLRPCVSGSGALSAGGAPQADVEDAGVAGALFRGAGPGVRSRRVVLLGGEQGRWPGRLRPALQGGIYCTAGQRKHRMAEAYLAAGQVTGPGVFDRRQLRQPAWQEVTVHQGQDNMGSIARTTCLLREVQVTVIYFRECTDGAARPLAGHKICQVGRGHGLLR